MKMFKYVFVVAALGNYYTRLFIKTFNPFKYMFFCFRIQCRGNLI